MPITEFQNHNVHEVTDGASRILVSPEHGARLLTWSINGKPVIHWPADADWSNVAKIRGGNPILFPFIARHFVDGEIGLWVDARGVKHALAMHGFARTSSFEVESDQQSELRMRLVENDSTLESYPFYFEFIVSYRLEGESLIASFSTTNKGDVLMPYYAGHHFYFAVPHADRSQWEVFLLCEKWGRQNANDGSIQYQPAAAQVGLLSDEALVDRMHVGLQAGEVELRERSSHRKVVFDLNPRAGQASWYAVTTWTLTPQSDFYCVEPWLGLPNAIHHKDGLRWIEPGQTEIATCRLTAQGW